MAKQNILAEQVVECWQSSRPNMQCTDVLFDMLK